MLLHNRRVKRSTKGVSRTVWLRNLPPGDATIGIYNGGKSLLESDVVDLLAENNVSVVE